MSTLFVPVGTPEKVTSDPEIPVTVSDVGGTPSAVYTHATTDPESGV